MDEEQRKEDEQPGGGSQPEQPQREEIDAAKLSDEAATQAARAFLGTAEPEETVSVDEAKSVLRRAGAVAEAEPEAPAALPEPEPQGAPTLRWEALPTAMRRRAKTKAFARAMRPRSAEHRGLASGSLELGSLFRRPMEERRSLS